MVRHALHRDHDVNVDVGFADRANLISQAPTFVRNSVHLGADIFGLLLLD